MISPPLAFFFVQAGAVTLYSQSVQQDLFNVHADTTFSVQLRACFLCMCPRVRAGEQPELQRHLKPQTF